MVCSKFNFPRKIQMLTLDYQVIPGLGTQFQGFQVIALGGCMYCVSFGLWGKVNLSVTVSVADFLFLSGNLGRAA